MRRRMPQVCALIFLGGLVLLFVSSCDGGVPIVSPRYIPPKIADVEKSMLEVVLQVPDYMRVNSSYRVRVSLVPKGGEGQVSSILKEKYTVAVSNLEPVGTPGATVQNVFGAGYEPYATASLDASSFDIMPNNNDVKLQSLQQPELHWDWVITPLHDNMQTIGVNIVVQWIRSQSGGSTTLPTPTFSLGYAEVSRDIDDPNDPSRSWSSIRSIVNAATPTVLAALLGSFITWLVSAARVKTVARAKAISESNSKLGSTAIKVSPKVAVAATTHLAPTKSPKKRKNRAGKAGKRGRP